MLAGSSLVSGHMWRDAEGDFCVLLCDFRMQTGAYQSWGRCFRRVRLGGDPRTGLNEILAGLGTLKCLDLPAEEASSMTQSPLSSRKMTAAPSYQLPH